MKTVLVVNPFTLSKITTRKEEKVPANLVPAAAVRREGQALFGMIGRKEHVDCLTPEIEPHQGITVMLLKRLSGLE